MNTSKQSQFIIEGLEAGYEIGALGAYESIVGEEYAELGGFEEAYQGEYRSDEDFAEEMAEELGLIDNNLSWPHNCIDWECAAKELMYDYSEENGHYFRNL